ncbi:uncharacterized protein LOC118171542 [Oxyura jamaicensis]|uniref:uncharacterized protein LOC118171542 n=1 Tax=Oxyura jamaicensis TaxID=8884 RepID=UPI0015A5682F|nr:uncharacterized protein LOC118171542 [Oxyura jamaicensis]
MAERCLLPSSEKTGPGGTQQPAKKPSHTPLCFLPSEITQLELRQNMGTKSPRLDKQAARTQLGGCQILKGGASCGPQRVLLAATPCPLLVFLPNRAAQRPVFGRTLRDVLCGKRSCRCLSMGKARVGSSGSSGKIALAGAPQQWDELCKAHSSPKTQERQSSVNHAAHVAGWYLQRPGLGTAPAAWRGGKRQEGREGARRAVPTEAQAGRWVPWAALGENPTSAKAGLKPPASTKLPAAPPPRLHMPSFLQHRWPWHRGGLMAHTPGSERPPARAGRQPRAPGCHGDEKQQETACWEEGRRKEEKAFQAFVNHRADRGPSRREGKIPSQW